MLCPKGETIQVNSKSWMLHRKHQQLLLLCSFFWQQLWKKLTVGRASHHIQAWAPELITQGRCHSELEPSPPPQAMTVWTKNSLGTPAWGWLSISLAVSQQLLTHTPLMNGMHLWEVCQGLGHNLWPQNKGNLTHRDLDLGPGLSAPPTNLNWRKSQTLFNCWGESTLCSWACKHFSSRSEVQCLALPFEALILFSSVYTGTSPVAFKAAKYAVLYKLTKLANNCLMTA